MVKTDIYWINAENFGTVTIMRETEKAILVIYSQRIRKGTSRVFEKIEHEQWIPKSIWMNDKNYTESKYMGEGDIVKYFHPPYFLVKNN